ncbi:hypothetical protein UT300012_23140 [Paraclostridium bifermentans]
MFDLINSDLILVIPRTELDSRYNLIESCDSAGPVGRDYVIVVEKERVGDLVDKLCCGNEKNKTDIMKRLNLNILADLILGSLEDEEDDDTLTEYLVRKLGSMDGVLKHYGLLSKTPEEEAVENFVENNNLLDDNVIEDEIAQEDDYLDDYDDYDPNDDDLEGVDDTYIEVGTESVSNNEVNEPEFADFSEEIEKEEEPGNAYAMMQELEEREEENDILAPANLYKDEGEDFMLNDGGFYRPPNDTTLGSSKDSILSLKTRNNYDKEESAPVPHSNVSEYIKSEVKEEDRQETNEETLLLRHMVKIMCSKLELNYDDVQSQAEHEVELAKNPNFTEEELQTAIGKLLGAKVLSGVESEFYIDNFEKGQVEMVTKILRDKLKTIEGSF